MVVPQQIENMFKYELKCYLITKYGISLLCFTEEYLVGVGLLGLSMKQVVQKCQNLYTMALAHVVTSHSFNPVRALGLFPEF